MSFQEKHFKDGNIWNYYSHPNVARSNIAQCNTFSYNLSFWKDNFKCVVLSAFFILFRVNKNLA